MPHLTKSRTNGSSPGGDGHPLLTPAFDASPSRTAPAPTSPARRWLLPLASAISLMLGMQGCSTHLQVVSERAQFEELQEAQRGSTNAKMLQGIVYYLPTLRLEMVATWNLITCPVDGNDPDATVNLTVQITERHVADYAHPYLIDYTTLDAPLKHTKLVIALYPNGTLKSINGSIEDKAGAVVTSILQFAKSLTAHAVAQPNGQQPQVRCSESATEALNLRDRVTGQIEDLNARVLQVSSTQPIDHDKLRALNADLRAMKSALTAYLSMTSYSQTLTWVPDNLDDTRKYSMKRIGQRKLFSLTNGARLPFACVLTSLKSPTARDGNGNENTDPIQDSRFNPQQHFTYRIPALATFRIQASHLNGDGRDPCSKEGFLVQSKEIHLPQAGFHATLPLRNQAFDNNTIVAEFSPSGQLEKFEFSTNAEAEGLAQALAGAARTATEIKELRKTSELREIQAKTELLKAEAALIEAERALQALKGRSGDPE